MPNIKLQSSDGEIFEVDIEIAKVSNTIKAMLEDFGIDDNDEEVVPLPKVNSTILKKVIEWATHHRDDNLSTSEEIKFQNTARIRSWKAEFLKVDQKTLFGLIDAANYLDIKILLDITCKTVAKMIKGQTPEKLREIFRIKSDFTASEEEEAMKNIMDVIQKKKKK